jgi:hypothetical protein
MPTADDYRTKAAELHARTKSELDGATRAELQHLALSYLRLADQAEKNARSDLVYETPAEPSRHVVQQQQQPQPQPQPETKEE